MAYADCLAGLPLLQQVICSNQILPSAYVDRKASTDVVTDSQLADAMVNVRRDHIGRPSKVGLRRLAEILTPLNSPIVSYES